MTNLRTTKRNILDFIALKGRATAYDMARFLGLSRQTIHRHLNDFVTKGTLRKTGKSPKVFYLIAEDRKPVEIVNIDPELQKLINENFLIFTPIGEKEEGFIAFVNWCEKQKLPIEKTAREYAEILKKYAPYKKDGLIDGMHKMTHAFEQVFLDKVFYLDFYSIERFGKTKLGQLLLYAKQSQNVALIKELVQKIKPSISSLIKIYEIDAVGFIPPTIKREVQLMKELERNLNLSIPIINLVKIKTPFTVAQKTLTKLGDRIENARATIVPEDTREYKTLLLIDDALGSGATLNEVAQKIKNQKLAKVVIGLAITGSFSGFEIISEV